MCIIDKINGGEVHPRSPYVHALWNSIENAGVILRKSVFRLTQPEDDEVNKCTITEESEVNKCNWSILCRSKALGFIKWKW